MHVIDIMYGVQFHHFSLHFVNNLLFLPPNVKLQSKFIQVQVCFLKKQDEKTIETFKGTIEIISNISMAMIPNNYTNRQ